MSRPEADLFLVHAPSVYDFRERDDMLFAHVYMTRLDRPRLIDVPSVHSRR